jgi:hypothetical protein
MQGNGQQGRRRTLRKARRDPRPRPSNIWWKMMTMKRVVNSSSPVVARVRPEEEKVNFRRDG